MNTAKIIAVTQPLVTTEKYKEYIFLLNMGEISPAERPNKYLTAEEFIAYTARVSNPSNQHNTLTAPKLLKYLITHKHWSPFEMVSVTMDIETTRDIAHQIVRHRSFSFQEFSQRYADPTKDMGFVTREARLQDIKNRQNSIETDDNKLQKEWQYAQEYIADQCQSVYNDFIQRGIAKEQASQGRFVHGFITLMFVLKKAHRKNIVRLLLLPVKKS